MQSGEKQLELKTLGHHPVVLGLFSPGNASAQS